MAEELVGDSEVTNPPQVSAGPEAAFVLQRGTSLGRYVLLDWIGAGGMGVVYAAYDPELDRRVALKLVRADVRGDEPVSEGRARLLREARALARVSHPNVVPVHDVGTVGQDVFLAMEFIDGVTLRQWLQATPRTTEEVVEAFLKAGRGLSAAHAAGVVHRDFKPENVLVDRRGHLYVTDFGQARPPGPLSEAVATSTPSSPVTTPPLTEQGALVGTPAYMAPELFRGVSVDHHADQFSFCVALYEALHGERPFEGKTVEELAFAVTGGRVRAPARPGRSAPWLETLLKRGLAVRPEDRFPSMEALLEALARSPGRRRLRWIAGGVAAAAVVAVAWSAGGAYLAHRRQLCSGGEGRLAGAWDASRRQEVQGALLGSGVAYAQAAWTGVARTLDAYAREWVAGHHEACAATQLRGEQSERVLDLRMRCLDRRRTELAALTGMLAHADAQAVERAVLAAEGLRRPAVCSDVEALSAVVEPASASQRSAVDQVRGKLAQADALLGLGKYGPGLEVATDAAEQARTVDYAPAVAETLYKRGDLEGRKGDPPRAEKTLRESVLVAERAGYDELRANALIELIWYVGYRGGRYAEGLAIADGAEAVLDRLGAGREDTRAGLLNYKGILLRQQGHLPEAVAVHERALALRERANPPGHPKIARMLNNLGVSYEHVGRLADALSANQRARESLEHTLGPVHPDLAGSLTNIASVQLRLGRYREAEATARRAHQIYLGVFGPEHPQAAPPLVYLSAALLRRGVTDEAVEVARAATAIRERAGVDHPDLAGYLITLGAALRGKGELAEARAAYQRALDIGRAKLGEDHPLVAMALSGLGDCALESKDARGAVAYQRRACELADQAHRTDRDLANHLTSLGQALLAAGQPREGQGAVERALTIEQATPGDPAEDARTRFVLARLLWTRPEEREHALGMVHQAREGQQAIADADPAPAAEMARWIAVHASQPAARSLLH